MARKNTNKKNGISQNQPKISSNIKTVNPVSTNKTTFSKSSKNIVSISHEQIAERARNIWINRGCPNNKDSENWYDAENQLKQELGIN